MWAALIVAVILGAVAQIFMKEAMNHAGPVPTSQGWQSLIGYFVPVLLSWPIIAAITLYVVSIILWLGVLSLADLSLARPVMSLGYLVTMAYGYYVGENLTGERVLGTFLIIGGLYFVARSE